MVEVLVAILGLGILVLAYVAVQATGASNQAKSDARAYQADAAVQRARAAKLKKVLETWGEDADELERKIEAAHGGKVGPAVDSFTATVRRLRKDKDGKGPGSGGEGGGVPGA